LFPLTIDLSEDKVEVLLKNTGEIQRLGFEIEQLGPEAVGIKSAPTLIKDSCLPVIFDKMALDLLNNAKGKEVLVSLKGDRQFVGTLLAFDIHINLVLDNIKEIENNEVKRSLGLTFLRGDTIIFISPASTALKKE